MQYLLFGMAALVAALIAARLFTRANTVVLARQLRVVLAIAALGGAGLILIRGTAGYAVPLVMLALWLFTGAVGGGSATCCSRPGPRSRPYSRTAAPGTAR